MQIKFNTTEYDYRRFVTIYIDGKEVFSVCDGEPEDNTLGRNFNDVFKLPEIFKQINPDIEIIETEEEDG